MPPGETRPPVFFVDALPEGDHIELGGTQAHHAVTVRRTRSGETLALADGTGGLALCTVDTVHTGRHPVLTLAVHRRCQDGAPRVRVVLAQALVKGDRGELAVELATEAGADEIWPWRASRSVARWDKGTRGAKALQRWRTAARAAAQQSRRSWIPHVPEPVNTPELARLARDRAGVLVLDPIAGQRITDVELPTAGDLLLIIGPEGGFTGEELERLRTAGARAVRLGDTVLRSSTAGAVALGAVDALTDRRRAAP